MSQLETLRNKSYRDRIRHPLGASFNRFVLTGYVGLYRDRWSQEDPAWIFARVPGAFTWDDHDIFDGWGSYDDELNNCPAYQAIFAQAKTAFKVFQLGGEQEGAFRHVVGDGKRRRSISRCVTGRVGPSTK